MASNTKVKIFYLGTFLTSFGSLLFVMAIPSFFVRMGLPATLIGITIATHRFSGLAANVWFGPQIDRFDSRLVIIFTELFAALTTISLVLSWSMRDSLSLAPFVFFCGLRAVVIGIQSTSRNRVVKLLSRENQGAEASFVVWLNKVTQGAHAISSLAALVLITHGRFEYAILIDGISFVLGGISAWQLPLVDSQGRVPATRLNVFTAVHKFFSLHRHTFVLDALLSIVVSGTILLMVKLSQGDSKLVIIFNLIFGICIWLSSIFVHIEKLRQFHVVYWLVTAIGFLGLYFQTNLLWSMAFYFVAYMGYWILYHKYTISIQIRTPEDAIGGVMAARGIVAVVALSLGELFGGYVQKVISLNQELGARALIAVVAAVLALIWNWRVSKC